MTKHIPEWMLDLIERQDLEIKAHKQTIQEAYSEIAAMRDEFHAWKVEHGFDGDFNHELLEAINDAITLTEIQGIDWPGWDERAKALIQKAGWIL